jgi:glycosyltransferase involved in cell wall biosynthesis
MDQPGRRISTVSKAHDMRVAVVHDWLVDYGGAERVLEEILTLFPDADLFTLIDCPPADRRAFIENRKITTSFLQKFPFPDKLYRKYLAFMPLAVEQFDLSEYDIVISSSHAVAKGVLTHGDQVHISYFNGLMNYAWGQYHFYLKDAGLDRGLKGLLAKLILHRIRLWDVAAANRVDRYIANSASMANDIKRIYGRTSTVIYPPVDTDSFTFEPEKGDYYLAVARLVPIKRIDLIARAFSMMPAKKLVIIGDGPEMDRIKAVSGDNVHFHGARRREVVAAHMAKARALITASTEPFGIASVEAQACGTPVIAYGKGGALETIINNETGLFFYRQRPEEIVKAVNRFESPDCDFDPRVIRNNALRFSRENFRKNFKAFVEKSIAGESRSGPMVLRRGKERAPMSSPSGERELISELISTD